MDTDFMDSHGFMRILSCPASCRQLASTFAGLALPEEENVKCVYARPIPPDHLRQTQSVPTKRTIPIRKNKTQRQRTIKITPRIDDHPRIRSTGGILMSLRPTIPGKGRYSCKGSFAECAFQDASNPARLTCPTPIIVSTMRTIDHRAIM